MPRGIYRYILWYMRMNAVTQSCPATTRWRQIEECLLGLAKTAGPGARLPSERELSLMFRAQRGTVRRAIESLVRREALERRPSLGTFVAAALMSAPISLLQFRMDTADPVYQTHVQGIQQAARESGRALLPFLVLAETPRAFILNTLRAERAAGVLLDRFLVPDDVEFMLELSRLYPCVAVGKEFAQAPMPCVMAEYRESMAALARRLAGAGCRSMLLLAGNPNHLGMRQRADAFASAAAALGFTGLTTIRKPLIVDYVTQWPAYLAQFRQAVGAAPKPVGVCAVLWAEAVEVRRMAEAEGLKLGQDIHIATNPPECVVAQCEGMALAVRDEAAIGREAARLLLRRIEGEAGGQEIVEVPCRMVFPGAGQPSL